MAKKKVNFINEIETYLNDRFQFRYNTVKGLTEVKKKSDKDFDSLTDYLEHSILRELLKQDIKCSLTTLKALLHSDFCPKYNPFELYFNKLQKWNQENDYIQELMETVITTNQSFWYKAFKKWLVAVVATALSPKIVNHTVIVLSGGQGDGKTSWMLKLCPDQLEDYLFSGTINPNNKDTLIYLSQCILINLDELENLNRKDVGTLKEVITKQHINTRKAYARNPESMIRRASLMGSVNGSQFLNDDTGSRRFLAFEVNDLNYQHEVNMDMVFAQAYHLYKTGFKYYFDKTEIPEITQNNEAFQNRTIEEDFLLRYFEVIPFNEADNFLTATQVWERIAFKEVLQINNSSSMSIGKFLKKHGFERGKKSGVYKWAVKPNNGMELDKYKF